MKKSPSLKDHLKERLEMQIFSENDGHHDKKNNHSPTIAKPDAPIRSASGKSETYEKPNYDSNIIRHGSYPYGNFREHKQYFPGNEQQSPILDLDKGTVTSSRDGKK